MNTTGKTIPSDVNACGIVTGSRLAYRSFPYFFPFFFLLVVLDSSKKGQLLSSNSLKSTSSLPSSTTISCRRRPEIAAFSLTAAPSTTATNTTATTTTSTVHKIGQVHFDMNHPENGVTTSMGTAGEESGVEITCFTDVLEDATVYFQIIRLNKQIYAWIGCNSAKLGPLYAAAPTRPNNTVSVTSILGGTSDNTGSGIARRLVLRTGLIIILACNLPKNNPMLEISAEKKLVEKLISMGYTKPKSKDPQMHP